ncbi:hypothetical protein [Streptomyces camelliae]|uniref:CopG family transcriptional regulator n=1 Tax=Streptomyces camelliae TaxID=3004093 RepID=A0ABY7PJF6_9ACTN|nr:hypothetical protein [Streptomyces sp. HUAS 2-6]WBO68673.1 hypothetical protein O1G22_40640 [Streptomyces sp. HUAS 2-6]
MAKKKVEYAAGKGVFLTLNEIVAWAQDAMRSGASGDEVVEARASFSGRLQRIAVAVEDATLRKGEDAGP